MKTIIKPFKRLLGVITVVNVVAIGSVLMFPLTILFGYNKWVEYFDRCMDFSFNLID